MESAKAKALCSKNIMGISVNNGLVLIPFRKSADNYFNISRNPADFANPKRKKERKEIGYFIVGVRQDITGEVFLSYFKKL